MGQNHTLEHIARAFALCANSSFKGVLRVEKGGKQVSVAFSEGSVVAASSQEPSDSPLRMAKVLGILSPSQLSSLVGKVKGKTSVEVAQLACEVIGEDKSPEFLAKCVQRSATRIFAYGGGTISLTPGESRDLIQSTIPALPLLVSGLRSAAPATDLHQAINADGGPFQLSRESLTKLSEFGFEESDKVLLATLRDYAVTPNQIFTALTKHGIKVQHATSVVLALSVCGMLTKEPKNADLPEFAEISSAPSMPTPSTPQAATAAKTPAVSQTRSTAAKVAPEKKKKKRSRLSKEERAEKLSKMIAEKFEIIQTDGDYFALLGVTRETSNDEMQKAYFLLARDLHPDKIKALGLDDTDRRAHKVFSQVNKAFAVLTDKEKRAHYQEVLKAGGEKAYKEQLEKAESEAMAMFEAEDQHQQGEMWIRKGRMMEAGKFFKKAVELNPTEGEHLIMYLWTEFRLARDAVASFEELDPQAQKAIEMSPNSPDCHLYRGRMAKEARKDAIARACFNKVLELEPGHQSATQELRLL